MALLDKVISSVADRGGQPGSDELLNKVLPLLTSDGVLDQIVAKLNQSGLGTVVSSWMGNGDNQPISAEQIRNALGEAHLDQLSGQAGVPKDRLVSMLAENLPTLIDKLSPTGEKPAGGLASTALNLLRDRGIL